MKFKRHGNNRIKIMKQTPPLTLDQKWHALFSDHKSRKMKDLENKLNALLKSQGQSTNDYKEYSQLKKKLMGDIIADMPEAFNGEQAEDNQKMSKNKQYINQINQKLKKLENKLIKLPKEIEEVNSELLEISMSVCYERMIVHKKKLNGLDPQINSLREALKDLMVRKSESKEEYDLLYAYMHDLVGPDIIEQFDQMYLGGKVSD